MAENNRDRMSKWHKENKRNHVTVARLDFLGIKELFYEGKITKVTLPTSENKKYYSCNDSRCHGLRWTPEQRLPPCKSSLNQSNKPPGPRQKAR